MLPKIKAAEHDFASKNIDSIFIYTLCKIGKAFYARFTVFDCLCNRYVSVHISSSSWFNNKPYSDKEKMNKSPCVAFPVQVRFFDLRLTFLLTALRVDIRAQLSQELHGISLLGNLFSM